MQTVRILEQEAAEDIFFGQLVIIWARWFLILAGTILALWSTTNANDLVVLTLPIVALMAMNFFLHGRFLMEKPANSRLLILTSAIDVLIIMFIIGLWQPRGLDNQFYIFFFPILLAVSFVFPRRLSILYTAVIVLGYTAVCLLTDPHILTAVVDQKTLVQRLILLAAMEGVGTFYWRIQRDRRRAAAQGL
jgi:hypothetical protein